jgi:hypothetical protein
MTVRVQHWVLPSQQGKVAIPIEDFYLAQLRTGRVRTTIDGATATRGPGDLWIVKRGSTMHVETLSQLAVVETIAPQLRISPGVRPTAP